MGFRFRKSINLGNGFKINVSKSGIGYSWGIPGFRVSRTVKGRTRRTYSIPGTGIGYATESARKRSHRSSSGGSSKTSTPTSQDNIQLGNSVQLNAGNVGSYNSDEYQVFLNAISKYKKLNLISNILLLSGLLIYIPVFIFSFMLGIILKVYVFIYCKIPIEYQLDADTQNIYEQRCNMWYSLNSSKKLWQLTSYSNVSNKKTAAGADKLVNRRCIKIKRNTPVFLKTDMKFIHIALGNEQIYLLPDRVVIIKGTKIGSLSYDDIKISISDYEFIEGVSVPSDSEIVGSTWLKVNKNGTPDKRFKGNRQIPICKYGLITLQTSAGMDIRICCSNAKLLQNFK